jgi:L-lactate dehydrogenase
VNGPYGIRDVCLSVPTIVGRKGVQAQLEIEIWPKEVSALQHSAQVLRETLDQVLKGRTKAAGEPTAKPVRSTVEKPPASPRPVRVTMGVGGSGSLNGAGSRVTVSGLGQGNGRGGR